MARGRSNWVITVWHQDTGDQFVFGPYTQAQAARIVPKINAEFAASGDYEDDDGLPIVNAHPIQRWEDS